MKLYTVLGEKAQEGIVVDTYPYAHIDVGNRMIPLGKRDFPAPPTRLMAADLFVTREKKTTLLVAEKNANEPIALVLVITEHDNSSWFREWTLDEFEEVPCRWRGTVAGWGICPLCGVHYSHNIIHPNRGMERSWKEFQETDGIQTIAQGYVLPQLEPYRLGYSADLVRMCPGEVIRFGTGYHGEPQYNDEEFLLWTGEELRYGRSFEVFDEAYQQYRLSRLSS